MSVTQAIQIYVIISFAISLQRSLSMIEHEDISGIVNILGKPIVFSIMFVMMLFAWPYILLTYTIRSFMIWYTIRKVKRLLKKYGMKL
jgi:hypothetical protein